MVTQRQEGKLSFTLAPHSLSAGFLAPFNLHNSPCTGGAAELPPPPLPSAGSLQVLQCSRIPTSALDPAHANGFLHTLLARVSP